MSPRYHGVGESQTNPFSSRVRVEGGGRKCNVAEKYVGE